jgi:hypothetical protein
MVIVLVPLSIDLYFSTAQPNYLARARLQYDHTFPMKALGLRRNGSTFDYKMLAPFRLRASS